MNKVLKDIEELDRKQPCWIVDRDTARLLCLFIKILSRKFAFNGRPAILKVLEIGGGVGYSGIWMGLELQKIGGVLYTVESHDERFSLAEKYFKKAGLKNVFQIKGHAPEILDLIPGDFEMAFFDATKYEHVSYLKKVLPRMKRGGAILVDNVFSHQAELEEFFAYVKTLPNLSCAVLSIGKGVAVIFLQTVRRCHCEERSDEAIP